MNGAESLIRTAVAGGVEVCFANPGTSEMHLVAALDSEPGVRAVLGLFEGVLTGAADGYARMSGKPAMTLLHLGPGLANGMANLHNARRALSPIVNVVGHHTTWQRNYDPPLNSDVEVWAAPVSHWQRTSATSGQLSRDMADAISAALQIPGRIATLVVPADCQWDPAGDSIAAVMPPPAHLVGPAAVAAARDALAGDGGSGSGTKVLLLGATGLRTRGLRAAGRIARRTGCRLVSETFPARLERGPDLPATTRLPYFPEQAVDFFAGVRTVVLAGALDPVAFFGYQGGPSRLIPEGVEVIRLSAPTEDSAAALELLAEELAAEPGYDTPKLSPPAPARGALSPSTIAVTLAAHLPEGAVVIDEGVTAAGGFFPASATANRHSYLNLTGGAIGWGLPAGVGAAIAVPDRKVVVLEGDGSGMYTVQALWTAARENLNLVSVVFHNSVYRILQIELARAGVEQPGPQSLGLTTLDRPALDWVKLSQGLGVPAVQVQDAESLDREFATAVAEPGPKVIVVDLAASPDSAVAVPGA